tara:strand:- start:4665 stop:5180 length:516 start_codon:yes stop_codon:yes gene_type:complete
MSDTTQSPAELIRQVLSGDVPEIEACNKIPGWASDPRVGGFINLADAPAAIREIWQNTIISMAWPLDLDVPSGADKEALKLFRKEARKARKVCEKLNPEFIFAAPFARASYGHGATLIEEGLNQWHVTLKLNGVKIPIHFWSWDNGKFREKRNHLFAKIKIDTEQLLELFV